MTCGGTRHFCLRDPSSMKDIMEGIYAYNRVGIKTNVIQAGFIIIIIIVIFLLL